MALSLITSLLFLIHTQDAFGQKVLIDFEDGTPGKGLQYFHAFPSDTNALVSWVVIRRPDAPSGQQALLQGVPGSLTDRTNVLVFGSATYCNTNVATYFFSESGEADRGIGVMVRARDIGNYVMATANTLSKTMTITLVNSGHARNLAITGPLQISSGIWYQMSLKVEGYRAEVFFNHVNVLSADIPDMFSCGQVGLVTKTDSTGVFDDFSIIDLNHSAG